MSIERMEELLKVGNKVFVFPVGVVYTSVVILTIMGISIPSTAGPVNETNPDDSSFHVAEGPNHADSLNRTISDKSTFNITKNLKQIGPVNGRSSGDSFITVSKGSDNSYLINGTISKNSSLNKKSDNSDLVNRTISNKNFFTKNKGSENSNPINRTISNKNKSSDHTNLVNRTISNNSSLNLKKNSDHSNLANRMISNSSFINMNRSSDNSNPINKTISNSSSMNQSSEHANPVNTTIYNSSFTMNISSKHINLQSSLSILEISGHGGLADVLGITDDDDLISVDGETDYRIDDFEDEGGGYSDIAAESSVASDDDDAENNSTIFYGVTVKCFRCHGNGVSGCNIATMIRNIQVYSVACRGKCLNLTSGSQSVYDCAHDMLTHADTCLQNVDTIMCFCAGNFCNGPPPDISQSFNSLRTPPLFPRSPLPLDDYDYSYEIDYTDNTSFQPSNNSTNVSSTEILSKNEYQNQNRTISSRKSEENIIFSNENDTVFETSRNLQNQTLPDFPHAGREDINFVISKANSNISKISDLVKETNVIDVDDLRVGKLKDVGLGVDSGGCKWHEKLSSCVVAVVCYLLMMCFISDVGAVR